MHEVEVGGGWWSENSVCITHTHSFPKAVVYTK